MEQHELSFKNWEECQTAIWKCRRAIESFDHRRHAVVDLVRFAFGYCQGLIRPIQVFSEILALLEYVAPLRPRRILEIGTASGGTLFLFCRIAAPDASVISVDLPDGELSYPPWKAELYHAFKLPGQSIHLLRADSHDVRTLSNVKGLLEDSKLDLLFIDGDHSYMGVKQDFEMYAPLAGERGIVALHDIVPIQPRQAWCEVDRFWIELRDRYPYREFVEDWRQGWGGIGMLTRTAPAQ